MYLVLGLTFLSAILVMVVVMTASYFLTKISKKLNERAMKAKDTRMKATE